MVSEKNVYFIIFKAHIDLYHTFLYSLNNYIWKSIFMDSSALDFVPIVITFIVAAGFVVVTMLASHCLGPKRHSKTKFESFECGIESQGNARIPFSIKYFLIAILFVLFDVEVIFMYPWAVNFKELGLIGFLEMGLFISFFMVGFFYIIKKGALKWE